MNFFELLGVSSDQLADAMPEKIVEVRLGGAGWVRRPPPRPRPPRPRTPSPPLLTTPAPPPCPPPKKKAFHAGGKEAVREVVYNEVSDKLRAPLHVRAADPAGGEAVYGAGQPGRPVYLVKDSKDLFTRIHEDGTPYASRDEPLMAGGMLGGGGGAARPRKPRPSGGAMGPGGQSARDKERDATWEVRGRGGVGGLSGAVLHVQRAAKSGR
jgi:hypothetical protein